MYLHHKQNRRVDVLLVTLLRIPKDKAFERFHKMETGKLTHRVCEINKRHKAAGLMQQNNQCQVSTIKTDKEWTIQSQSQQNIYYTIKLQNNHCDCKNVCSSCGVCTHHFTSLFNSIQAYSFSYDSRSQVCKTCCIISMRQPTVEFSNI